MDDSVRKSITVNDVMHAGECHDGVMDWYNSVGIFKTAIPVRIALSMCETQRERNWVELAAGIRGDGYGYGYGGDGDGDGCYGYGYGGDGDGDGE